MIDPINTLDGNGLANLKRIAKDNSPEAVKQVAQQFEAIFMQIVLKTMRDASPGDGGLLESDSTKFYEGLHDQQMASVMASRGGFGLAAALEKQLSGLAPPRPANYDLPSGTPVPVSAPASSNQTPVAPVLPNEAAPAAPPVQTSGNATQRSVQNFASEIWPQAADAARTLGVPTHFLVGQAALESGWGRSEIKYADGSPSFNLFNIKAGAGWSGKVVEATTTEYENGVAQNRVERFRAYGSYAEGFQDYARLIRQSPRYAQALGQTDAQGFARALQSGGYATDPSYADKLTRVINGSTLRQNLLTSIASNS